MRIGQIVFINDSNLPNVQTGIITKRQKEDDQYFWYEVLCNDGQNHVLPGFLLSPARFGSVDTGKKYKNIIKKYATLYKNNPHLITLYT